MSASSLSIVNIMLGRGRGGIEQAALDYARALLARGHRVTFILATLAAIAPDVEALRAQQPERFDVRTLRHFGAWDVFASWRLKQMLAQLHPDVVICHGNRPLQFALRAREAAGRIVAVAHNYSSRHWRKADGLIAISQDIAAKARSHGCHSDRVFLVPNMIACEKIPLRLERRQPPIIGAMARLVPKKGMDVFLKALAVLVERGFIFQATLAGAGPEEAALSRLAQQLRLEEKVRFTGWVSDKAAFYADIDIFCLPSRHEPFGIVALEAMAHGVPIVSTKSEGPSEILAHGKDGLLVEVGDVEALADGLATLLIDEARASTLAAGAFVTVHSRYAMPVVAERLEDALRAITRNTPSV